MKALKYLTLSLLLSSISIEATQAMNEPDGDGLGEVNPARRSFLSYHNDDVEEDPFINPTREFLIEYLDSLEKFIQDDLPNSGGRYNNHQGLNRCAEKVGTWITPEQIPLLDKDALVQLTGLLPNFFQHLTYEQQSKLIKPMGYGLFHFLETYDPNIFESTCLLRELARGSLLNSLATKRYKLEVDDLTFFDFCSERLVVSYDLVTLLGTTLSDSSFIRKLTSFNIQTIFNIVTAFDFKDFNLRPLAEAFREMKGSEDAPVDEHSRVGLFGYLPLKALKLQDFIVTLEDGQENCFFSLARPWNDYERTTPIKKLLGEIVSIGDKLDAQNYIKFWERAFKKADKSTRAAAVIALHLSKNEAYLSQKVRKKLREATLAYPDLYFEAAAQLITNNLIADDKAEKCGLPYVSRYVDYIKSLADRELTGDHLVRLVHVLNAFAEDEEKNEARDLAVPLIERLLDLKLLKAGKFKREEVEFFIQETFSLLASEETKTRIYRIFENFLGSKPQDFWSDLVWTQDVDSPMYLYLSVGPVSCMNKSLPLGERQHSVQFLSDFILNKSKLVLEARSNLRLLNNLLTSCSLWKVIGEQGYAPTFEDFEEAIKINLEDENLLSQLNNFHDLVFGAHQRAINDIFTEEDRIKLVPLALYIEFLTTVLESSNEDNKKIAYDRLCQWALNLVDTNLDVMHKNFLSTIDKDLSNILNSIGEAYGVDSVEFDKFAQIAGALGGPASSLHALIHLRRAEEGVLSLPVSEGEQLCPALFQPTDDIPDLDNVSHQDLVDLVDRFERLGEGDTAARDVILGLEEAYFTNLLQPGKEGKLSRVGLALKQNIAFLRDLPSEALEKDGTFKFYTSMLSFISSIQKCEGGKNKGILMFYRENVLGKALLTLKIDEELKVETLKEEIARKFKAHIMQLITCEGPVLYSLCQVANHYLIIEPPHQDHFVESIVGPIFGTTRIEDPVKYDINGGVVDPQLLILSKKELVDAFAAYCTPENFIDFLHRHISERKESVDEEVRKEANGFESTLANQLSDEDRERYYEPDEDDLKYTLSKEGIRIVLRKLGFLVKAEEEKEYLLGSDEELP